MVRAYTRRKLNVRCRVTPHEWSFSDFGDDSAHVQAHIMMEHVQDFRTREGGCYSVDFGAFSPDYNSGIQYAKAVYESLRDHDVSAEISGAKVTVSDVPLLPGQATALGISR